MSNTATRQPDRVTVYDPEDCHEPSRQYLEHAPRRTGPTLIAESGVTRPARQTGELRLGSAKVMSTG